MNYTAGGTGSGCRGGGGGGGGGVAGSGGQRPNRSWTKHMKYGANFSLSLLSHSSL